MAAAGGVGGPADLKPWGGRVGEMELGGVGKAEGCLPEETGLATTAAKVFLPVQKVASRGFGMLTDSVLPAKAKAMLEVPLLLVEAMFRTIRYLVFLC